MHALDAFCRAANLLKAHPIILLAASSIAVLKLMGTLLALTHPLLYIPGVLISIVGSPYLVVGLYSLIETVNNGERPSLQSVLYTANIHYIRLFLGRLVIWFAVLITLIGIIVVVSYIGVSAVQIDLADITGATLHIPSPSVLAGLTLFTIIALLIPLAPLFFVQFFDAAIVADNAYLQHSFVSSVRLVWNNIKDASVYTVFRASLFGFVSFPALAFRNVALAGILVASVGLPGLDQYVPVSPDSTVAMTMLFLAAFAFGTIGEAITRTYHYLYYTSAPDMDTSM